MLHTSYRRRSNTAEAPKDAPFQVATLPTRLGLDALFGARDRVFRPAAAGR